MTAHGIESSVSLVPGYEVANTARRALQSGASVIVAGGGDGTISTVASVVAGTQATLGVLPLGTLNHFAKDLHIPLDPAEAAQIVVSGNTIPVDIGDLNGRTFINNASIGLFPRLVWERERERRGGRRKWTALALASARVWKHYRRVRVIIRAGDEERRVRTPFVLVGNNEYELDGFRLGGRLRLDGGRLHVSMAPDMTRVGLVRLLLAAFTGRLRGEERLDSFSVSSFSIEARRRRLGVSLDGELWIVETPLRFHIRPHALRVLVPAS
jgi:diacylglycerol kinase family enzyme